MVIIFFQNQKSGFEGIFNLFFYEYDEIDSINSQIIDLVGLCIK